MNSRQKSSLRQYYAQYGYKPCWGCTNLKSANEFNKLKIVPGGLARSCRMCQKKTAIEARSKNLTQYKATAKRWVDKNKKEVHDRRTARNNENRERINDLGRMHYQKHASKMKERTIKYYYADEERAAAHRALQTAVRGGHIKRAAQCESCQKKCTTDGHHHSYQQEYWLDVQWLCRKCHSKIHHQMT